MGGEIGAGFVLGEGLDVGGCCDGANWGSCCIEWRVARDSNSDIGAHIVLGKQILEPGGQVWANVIPIVETEQHLSHSGPGVDVSDEDLR